MTTQTTPAAGGQEGRSAAGAHDGSTDGRHEVPGTARGTARGAGTGQEAHGEGQEDSRQGGGADRADTGGARTWTVELPAGLKLLSLNDRRHWAERYELNEVIKDAATTMARKAKLPRLQRARIVAVYEPPDRRPRDADNPIASVKAAVDGLVIAGVLPNDECPRYVTGIYCTIGERYPRGRLVLHVTEVRA